MRQLALGVTLAVCGLAWQPFPLVAQRPGAVAFAAQGGPEGGVGGGQGNRGGQGQGGQGGQGQGGRGFLRGRGELPTGTASVRGQVTSDTGSPVRRAQVRATSSGPGGTRLISTDADGRFELRDLPAGQWTLTASKPGYVTQRFGQRRPNETVPPIELADGQRLGGANFALRRGGAITGRVFDDFGDPVANARVQVLRSQFVNGRRRLNPMGGSDQSDDTGAFRLYGLAPGDYYISATLRAESIESSADQTAYSPTYYPGTGNVADAQRVTLGAGEEQSVAFGLQPVRTVRVSGVVIASTGSSLEAGIVALTSSDADDAPLDILTAGRITAGGSFTVTNVVPGAYVLSIAAGGFAGGRGGPARGAQGQASNEPELASIALTVGTEDITGLSIATTRGATVDGKVVVEGASAPPALTSLRVTARALRPTPGAGGGAGAGRTARVAADGAFHLSSLIGPSVVRVEGLPSQWVVKSITMNGTDVADSSLDLRGTEQVTGARVVITDKIAELNGTVSVRAQQAAEYTVVVFPVDATRWAFPTRYVRAARADASGRFSLRGLPPHASYLAAAVSYIEDGDWQDPAFLESLREKATAVGLREAETKTVELTLVER